jgi:hypothetical protein
LAINCQLNPGVVVDFALKGDHLETQMTGQPAFPIANDKFFLKVVDAQLDFDDGGGKVVAVVLHQRGRERDVRAARMQAQ